MECTCKEMQKKFAHWHLIFDGLTVAILDNFDEVLFLARAVEEAKLKEGREIKVEIEEFLTTG